MNAPLANDPNDVGEELVAERRRQIIALGYTPDHDDSHKDGSMALAAACYATPIRLYQKKDYATSVHFEDPFPWWDGDGRKYNGNVLIPNDSLDYKDRRRMLVKAGALIIAEIQRIDRAQDEGKDLEALADE